MDFVFFFFKQKTAYEISACLVGSEMCIRDRLLLPPKIVQAHDDGIIHFHDMDYYIQKMHNCDLVNLKDMFAKGTVINDKLIETPKSLQTACTCLLYTSDAADE